MITPHNTLHAEEAPKYACLRLQHCWSAAGIADTSAVLPDASYSS